MGQNGLQREDTAGWKDCDQQPSGGTPMVLESVQELQDLMPRTVLLASVGPRGIVKLVG
jgi:hypothetical protein